MTQTTQQPRTAEELVADMETAFRVGELGATALAIWELTHRFPEQASVARIYSKKLLRDPELSSVSLDILRSDARALRKQENPEQVAQLAALGLLKFPRDRYLTLCLVDVAEQLERLEWAGPALNALGPPADDDVVLLNANAALAQTEGNYDIACQLFARLHQMEPTNETIIQNYSASLIGLKRHPEAIELLEKNLGNAKEPKSFVNRLTYIYHADGLNVAERLRLIDRRFFSDCESQKAAKVHADISLFLQDFDEVIRGLSALNEFERDPVTEYEIAEAEFTLNRLDEALRHYAVRFEAFPYLEYCRPSAARYYGQFLKDETLFVWGEQGIGDELLFSLFYEELANRVKNVTVAMDLRVAAPLARRYPDWTFIDRHAIGEDVPETDFACPSGDLLILFLREMLDSGTRFTQPLFMPDEGRAAEIIGLLGEKLRPRIGISWRGGTGVHGKIRSVDLPTLMKGLPEDADVDVISFQYDADHENEVIEHGDRRIALSGLDNRQDLEGVFSLMSQCDAVLSVDNAVAHFACFLGVPTYVLTPAGQTQFRWKNKALRNLFFPTAELIRQPAPGHWDSAIKDAWELLLSNVGR